MDHQSDKNNQEQIKEMHHRRLHKLIMKQAQEGISVDPKVPLEIEDIIKIIKELESTERKEKQQIQSDDLVSITISSWAGMNWNIDRIPPELFPVVIQGLVYVGRLMNPQQVTPSRETTEVIGVKQQYKFDDTDIYNGIRWLDYINPTPPRDI